MQTEEKTQRSWIDKNVWERWREKRNEEKQRLTIAKWKLKRRERVAAARCNGSGFGDREQSKYESGRN